MKIHFPVTILISMMLLAGCQTATDNSSNSAADAATMSGDASRTRLIVEYNETQHHQRPAGYNTIDNELDRFYYLEQNFKAVFRKALSDYDLDFQLYPASPAENTPLLELSLLSFDSPSPIELELRFWVILEQGGEKKDFGIIRARIVPQRPMTDGSIERDLNAIYTDAAKQVLEKILPEL